MSNRATFIEPAKPEDARGIFELLTEAFGASYLKFTVYQSPRAASFLADQIARGLAEGQPSFFLLRRGERTDGFYNAVQRSGEFFLNYIAAGVAARSEGAGQRMLDHFEDTALARGCASLGLDVFRSNTTARTWYERHGYLTRGSRFTARFELSTFSVAAGPALEFDSLALARALEVEANKGCSSFDCAYSGMSVRLGLIGGAVCNLMEPEGADALAVAPAVARRFGASRRWILATAPEAFANAPPPESQEEAIYMTRTLERKEPRAT